MPSTYQATDRYDLLCDDNSTESVLTIFWRSGDIVALNARAGETKWYDPARHGHTLQFGLPGDTDAVQLSALIRTKIRPLVDRAMQGYEPKHDDGGAVRYDWDATFSRDAADACEQIRTMLTNTIDYTLDPEETSTREWLKDLDLASAPLKRVTAATTDQELVELSAQAVAEAQAHDVWLDNRLVLSVLKAERQKRR